MVVGQMWQAQEGLVRDSYQSLYANAEIPCVTSAFIFVCVDYDYLDEARRGTKPEPSVATEENTDTQKADHVKEGKPLRHGNTLAKQDQ